MSDQNDGYMVEQLQRIAGAAARDKAIVPEPVVVTITPQAISTTARLVLVYEIAR